MSFFLSFNCTSLNSLNLHHVSMDGILSLLMIAFPVLYITAAAAKSLQSCPTLCDPIDGLPPGFGPWDSPGKNTGVGCHFLLQCVKVKSLSDVWLLATSWTAAYQAPPSMGFSRQEYWSGVPLPSPNLYLITHQIFLVLHIFYWIFVCPCLQVLLKP